MRRFVRPAVWAAVFLACAGAGAFLAAHTDPFPPGVDRPTGTGLTGPSRPTGPTPSPDPVEQHWTGAMPLSARHDLYVGGSCRSRWRTELRLAIAEDGTVGGVGVGVPVGEAACDFTEAQAQARRIRLAVGGRLAPSGDLRLTFDEVSPVPAGSTDLAGLLAWLAEARLVLPVDGRAAALQVHHERDDGNRGTYVVDGAIHVRCRSTCGA
jgi:hypothetical protein